MTDQSLDILILLKPELAQWLAARLAARGLRSTIVDTLEPLRQASNSGRPAMAVTMLADIGRVRAAGNLPVVNFEVFLHMREDGAGGRKRVFDAEQFFRRIDAIAARRFSVPTLPLPEPLRVRPTPAMRLRRLARLVASFCRHRRERLVAIQQLLAAKQEGLTSTG